MFCQNYAMIYIHKRKDLNMRLLDIKKIDKDSYFLHRYNLVYENKCNDIKEYEIVSRNKSMTLNSLGQCNNAISIVGIKDDKMLLLREFRLAINQLIYNFPCGLIDEGETPLEAAKRELKEETGLDIISITKMLPSSYSAMGFSDEKTCLIFAKVDGVFEQSTSPNEEIEPIFVSREEMRELLKQDNFAGKTQAIAYLWSHPEILV